MRGHVNRFSYIHLFANDQVARVEDEEHANYKIRQLEKQKGEVKKEMENFILNWVIWNTLIGEIEISHSGRM